MRRERRLQRPASGSGGRHLCRPREDGYDITVASEIMAVLCLASDITDLKNRLARLVVGYTYDEKPVTAGDLNAQGAMAALLKDALKPNLVQTLEHTPAFVQCPACCPGKYGYPAWRPAGCWQRRWRGSRR